MANKIERGADTFARLYDDTVARVYGVALQVLTDPAQAAQVTEEVYLGLWREGPATLAPCSTLAGLVAHAHRLAVDRVRADTPHHEEAREVSHPTSAALTSLPAGQGRAIALAYFEARRSAEVARTLGITPRAAQEQLRSGLMGLSGALGGHPPRAPSTKEGST